MSDRNRSDEEERFMDEIRPYVYGGALAILLGAAMLTAAVSGTDAYHACRAAGNSPFHCWVNE